MRAASEQADLQAVRRRRDRAGTPGHRARRTYHNVLTQYHIGLRKALEQTVVDHRLSAFSRFFRRLEDWHQRAAPSCPRFRQKLGSAREPSDMHVVAAHVRDGDGIAISVRRLRAAGIGKARRFLDRQRVHVGAQHDGGAVAISEQTYDAGFADPVRYFIAGGTKSVGRQLRRARFLHRQFGM